MEVLYAAAASPVPPPLPDLVPDLPLLADLVADDLPHLLALLPQADRYLQDEVERALHPTLTRVWCPRGRRGHRAVQTPGTNVKRHGFGAVAWRAGPRDWAVAAGRRAAPFCDQLRRLVARSTARDRVALVILDDLSIDTAKGSRLVRNLLTEPGDQLILVYTPPYDPDANRIEWWWRALRAPVTHNHQRTTLADLLADAAGWARDFPPDQVLAQIGSPFAPIDMPEQELDHAA